MKLKLFLLIFITISFALMYYYIPSLWIISSIGIITTLFFSLWKIPIWQLTHLKSILNDKDYAELEDKYRKTIAQIVGGIVILGGLYGTAKSIYISQESQITDRFTVAIEHLSSSEIEKKLGGVYELERIAKDSKRDYETVVEVLSSYIRTHSPKIDNLKDDKDHCKTDPEACCSKIEPDIIIQSILTVLGRRNYKLDNKDRKIDLTETDLQNYSLVGSNFENTNFSDSLINCTDFSNSNINRADFTDAHLINSKLVKASLNNSIFINSFLNNASFFQAKVKETTFFNAELVNTNMVEADLTDAFMQGAYFKQTRLRGAILKNTIFDGAVMNSVDLRGAKFLTRKQLNSIITNSENIISDQKRR